MVYNLKPVTLRGIESRGMLLTAEKGNKLTMLSTIEEIESRSIIS